MRGLVSTEAPPASPTPAGDVSLRELTWVVLRDNIRTLGGGLAAMELMRRTAVRRGWLDDDDNGVLVAASRLTPGTNVLAYCVGFGWRLKGAAGAVAALVAASLPGAAIVAALTAMLVEVDRYPVVRLLLAVGTIVAAALVLASTWPLVRPHIKPGTRRWATLIVVIAVATLLMGATPVQTLLVAAAVGAAVKK
jgi:chromate transporter